MRRYIIMGFYIKSDAVSDMNKAHSFSTTCRRVGKGRGCVCRGCGSGGPSRLGPSGGPRADDLHNLITGGWDGNLFGVKCPAVGLIWPTVHLLYIRLQMKCLYCV